MSCNVCQLCISVNTHKKNPGLPKCKQAFASPSEDVWYLNLFGGSQNADMLNKASLHLSFSLFSACSWQLVGVSLRIRQVWKPRPHMKVCFGNNERWRRFYICSWSLHLFFFYSNTRSLSIRELLWCQNRAWPIPLTHDRKWVCASEVCWAVNWNPEQSLYSTSKTLHSASEIFVFAAQILSISKVLGFSKSILFKKKSTSSSFQLNLLW